MKVIILFAVEATELLQRLNDGFNESFSHMSTSLRPKKPPDYQIRLLCLLPGESSDFASG